MPRGAHLAAENSGSNEGSPQSCNPTKDKGPTVTPKGPTVRAPTFEETVALAVKQAEVANNILVILGSGSPENRAALREQAKNHGISIEEELRKGADSAQFLKNLIQDIQSQIDALDKEQELLEKANKIASEYPSEPLYKSGFNPYMFSKLSQAIWAARRAWSDYNPGANYAAFEQKEGSNIFVFRNNIMLDPFDLNVVGNPVRKGKHAESGATLVTRYLGTMGINLEFTQGLTERQECDNCIRDMLKNWGENIVTGMVPTAGRTTVDVDKEMKLNIDLARNSTPSRWVPNFPIVQPTMLNVKKGRR